MNILLNNYCNQACEYCFAKDVLAEDKVNMTMENFEWLLEFSKASRLSEIRLIGGEPTLHPQFKEMVLSAMDKPYVTNLLLFSNGTFPTETAHLLRLVSLEKLTTILINYNSAENITVGQYTRLEENLKYLRSTKVNIILGINFYKDNQDYSYIIEACKRHGVRDVRWSLTVPNNIEKRSASISEYYARNKDLLMNFLKDCIANGLHPRIDCNITPMCMLSDDDVRTLAMISPDNLRVSHCQPVIDIKPTMEAIRCFAFSNEPVDVRKFKNVFELNDHFINTVDSKYHGEQIFDTCKDCATFKLTNKSCGCLAFREDK